MDDLEQRARAVSEQVATNVVHYMDTMYQEFMNAHSGSARKSLKVQVTQQVVMAVTAAMLATKRDVREVDAKVAEHCGPACWECGDPGKIIAAAIRQGEA